MRFSVDGSLLAGFSSHKTSSLVACGPVVLTFPLGLSSRLCLSSCERSCG